MDLRDLWRGHLSLRRLRVLVEHLPADSALASVIGSGWTVRDFLLADIFQAITGEVHYARPQAEAEQPALPPAIEAALRRRAQREEQR